MGKVIIEEMEFYAHHGCFLEEQIIGSRYLVNIEYEYDSARAALNDQLSDAVNYQQLYKVVKAQMKQSSHLLEHLTHRIVETIYAAFPNIISLTVRVSKLNPPVGGKVKSVSVELTR
ncbi:MAG TPA: dihydroneopterin aldolase [Bacteroidales bacterium]|nr:dihydroneopterin aldolase [Bacteroidales bacterium]